MDDAETIARAKELCAGTSPRPWRWGSFGRREIWSEDQKSVLFRSETATLKDEQFVAEATLLVPDLAAIAERLQAKIVELTAKNGTSCLGGGIMGKPMTVCKQDCDHCGQNKPCAELENGPRCLALCGDCAWAVVKTLQADAKTEQAAQESRIIAGTASVSELAELDFLVKVKDALFCATADPDLDMARGMIEALKKQGLRIRQAEKSNPVSLPIFIAGQFASEKSDLHKALDLIGPAQNEEHFQVRQGIVAMILRPIVRSFENKMLRVDPKTKRPDVRELEAELAQALAGTEFTAKVLMPDNVHNLVVDVEPKRFVFAGIDWASGPDRTMLKGVTFAHDCGECTPLGTFTGTLTYDLYFCAKSIPTVIARYGNNGQDYTSGVGSTFEPLIEAERRAHDRGLL